MPDNAASEPGPMPPGIHVRLRGLTPSVLLFLYWLPVALTCAWVLSLPVFPSQDGPLHLYYVNILRQLLAHQPGPYADTYYIKHYLTPYSAYYYGLVTLGHFVSLEAADKLIVCLYVTAFAGAARTLLRVVSGRATWAAFLCLPVLLNWPLMMGFINYSLSTCLAFFALAVWCSGIGQKRLQPRALFLLLICLMMVTHPVPWMITVSFALFELGVRLLRWRSARYRAGATPAMRSFRIDLGTALLACVPYLYLHRFSHVVQMLEPPHVDHDPRLVRLLSPLLLTYVERAQSFLRTLGLDVFVGGSLWSQLYYAGIAFLLLAAAVVALCSFVRGRQTREWHLSDTWLLFSGALLPFLLFLPDPLQGRYFFAVRMGILFFVGTLAAASTALRHWRSFGLAAAGFAYLLCFYTLGLAVHYITPAARALATLQHAPPIAPGGLPGLTMQPSGANDTPNLGFIPDNWGTAQYYRRNNLVLFNTAWLGDPLILVGVQPGKLHDLDSSYFESVPWYGSDFMPDDDTGSAILNKVGFVVMMRHNASVLENPFAENENETVPAKYARDWACTHNAEQAWYLCRRKTEPKLKEGK